MSSSRTKYNFHITLEINEDDDIQWSHLPEEIQAYFDSQELRHSVTDEWGYAPNI